MTALNSSDPNFDVYLSIIQDKGYWLTLAFVGFFLALTIIIGNSLLLFITYKDPQKTLRTPPCLLITNLSASDLLLGLLNVSLVAVRDVYRYKQVNMPFLELFRGIMSTVFITTIFVSCYSIVAMSTSCFVAINKPMEYKTIITKKRVKIFIGVLWVISLLTCILPMTNVPEKTYTMIYLHTHATVPAILLTVIYTNVFRALSRRTREVQREGYNSVASKALEREKKMIKAIVIILGLFYITYMPQYVSLHLLHFCESCKKSLTFHMIDVALSRFLYISSAINPFVYAWRVPKYNQAFQDCWKMCRGKLINTSPKSFAFSLRQSQLPSGIEMSVGGRDRAQSKPTESTKLWFISHNCAKSLIYFDCIKALLKNLIYSIYHYFWYWLEKKL